MLIDKVVGNAINFLAEEDRQLRSIHKVLSLLKYGIGIHHSGLLPFVKEVVELLFQEGLIKVLFTTEAFSMGLNMSAKTVFEVLNIRDVCFCFCDVLLFSLAGHHHINILIFIHKFLIANTWRIYSNVWLCW